MQLLSIQVGEAKPSPAGSLDTTAIDKQPVASAAVSEAGLVGDTIVDQKNHGGPDQAVYVYTRDDYDYWEAELGRTLPGGMFGENLTVAGLSSAHVAVGDRFQIGPECVIEAASARIPCAVFTYRMGEANWVARFRDGRRPGVYCRVISPGVVSVDDIVEHLDGASGVSILDTQDSYYDRSTPREVLEAMLGAPLAARTRENIKARLSRFA